MTAEHLALMRAYLKLFTVIPKREEYQEQAAIANELLPALIDTITDEELSQVMEEFRSYFLYSLMCGEPPAEQEQEAVAASVTSATPPLASSEQ